MKKFTLPFLIAVAAFGGYINDCNAMHFMNRINISRIKIPHKTHANSKTPSYTYPTTAQHKWTSTNTTPPATGSTGKTFWNRLCTLAQTNTGSNTLSCLASLDGGFFNSIALAITTRASTHTFPNLISWKKL